MNIRIGERIKLYSFTDSNVHSEPPKIIFVSLQLHYSSSQNKNQLSISC